MKKSCKVYEEMRAEISPEKTKALLEELEDEFRRMADRVDIDEENSEIKIEGWKGKLCKISGKLHIGDKKGKVFLEGEIEGRADMGYWIAFGVGILLFLISLVAFWPLLLISIAIDVVIVLVLFNSVKTTGKMLGDKFRDTLKNI